jgi:hypothetical protein
MFGLGLIEFITVTFFTLLIPFVIVALIVFAVRRGLGGEEIEMIQEIHRGFERMEKRVETLETLLLERRGEK